MADLQDQFKRSVQQIPEGERLPTPVQRSVTSQPAGVPDVQSTVSNFAEATNWMSSIGAAVASRASTALAQKMGTDLGKKPQGDLGVPLTEFDRTMHESYKTQAQSTLGLQANKLINDANLEMAKAPRITPEMIGKTNQTISIGLQNIFENAPQEIRPHLEYQYGSKQLGDIEAMNERMIREQKEDQRNNTSAASKVYADNAYSSSIQGNEKAAMQAVEATRRANEADVRARVRTPEEAKINIDTARKSMKYGKAIHDYEAARAAGKGEEFLKKFSEGDVSDPDYLATSSHLMGYINNQESLRSQDQNLAMAKFKVALAENPTTIPPSDIAELNTHLTPLQQQEMSLAYTQAIKAWDKKKGGVDGAMAVYTDINKFPLQSADNKNGAWEATYHAILQKPENIASGMTEDTAKLYAAAAAPVAIPAYTTELNAKLSTADPVNLESAGQALNYMMSHNLGQNIQGVGKEQIAMAHLYSQLRNTMEPLEAAQKAHETIFQKKPEQRKANEDALADYYKEQKKKNESTYGFIGRIADLSSGMLIRNMPGYRKDATDVFESYFSITNGDVATSTKLTKEYMNTQYGESNVNGVREMTLHPIERIPGVPHDAQGAIRSDIMDQANKVFQQDFKMYQEGHADHWFEARQRISREEAMSSKKVIDAIRLGYAKNPITGLVFDTESKREELAKHERIIQEYNTQPVTIVKHNRSGKEEVFEAAVQANPWAVRTGNPAQPVVGGYDIQLKTDKGYTNIPLNYPLTTSVQYNPRVDAIRDTYLKTVGLSTMQLYSHEMIKGSPKMLFALKVLSASRKGHL